MQQKYCMQHEKVLFLIFWRLHATVSNRFCCTDIKKYTASRWNFLWAYKAAILHRTRMKILYRGPKAYKQLTIFTKKIIIDTPLGPKYGSGQKNFQFFK